MIGDKMHSGDRSRLTAALAIVALTIQTACDSTPRDDRESSSAEPSGAAEPSSSAPSPTSPPTIDPNNFALPVDNPYFPLEPGTTYRFEGAKEGDPAFNTFTVTQRTKKILGVTNVVIVDRFYVNGRLEEITHDWYTQDRSGAVWYFGETIREYDAEGNEIPAKGEWKAGVDGAQPGIVMPGHPQVGDVFRPEYYKGKAEDRYRIRSLSAEVTTPYGSFSDVLVMTEQTRLEPGVLGLKFHVRGFGQVMESVAKGPHETLRLVSVTRRG